MTPTMMTTDEVDARDRERAVRFFWTWLILTTCVSLAGNMTHAWLTAQHDNRWLAVWVAAVAPTVLLLAVHGLGLLAKAQASGAVHRASVVATSALAVGAFAMSFVALRDLAVIAGIRPRLAPVLPLVVDLAIGVATLALVALGDKPAVRIPNATRSAAATSVSNTPTEKTGPTAAATRNRDIATPSAIQSAGLDADDPIRELAVQLVAQKATRKPVETVTAVLAAHGQGHPLNRIAKQAGVHHSAVSRIIDAAAEHRQLAAAA